MNPSKTQHPTRIPLAALTLICAVFTGWSIAAPTAAPTTNSTTKPSAEPADMPAVKLGKDGAPQATFMKLHEAFLKRGKAGKIGVLFLGDSITEGWNTKGKEVWTKTYANDTYNAANFGIGGDRTQHVLWRMDNGELDGIHPKVVVLMIGTNNTNGNEYTAEQIARADIKIVNELHQKLPDTKVLVLGIFPRGNLPTDAHRAKIKAINAELAKLDDGKTTRYLDIGDKFLTADGTLTKDMMSDYLHPGAKGYQIWADAMQPLLNEMMK
jgi:lysophospholipase L1-like esterase